MPARGPRIASAAVSISAAYVGDRASQGRVGRPWGLVGPTPRSRPTHPGAHPTPIGRQIKESEEGGPGGPPQLTVSLS